ncbi:DUF333 domain-containing protein [Rhodobacteraceae bacterium KN286]|uniref:DUF333 domain-containing protein n=1 Tax=Oceanomicrobium pacificus TaxID=2692916 RepID=A0A6B0TLZ8_9RHOB|nr:DUF333 domain-containing protein [Oceanomicrobium pacificus]
MTADGEALDAWDYFRAADQDPVTLANPAATFCVEGGGSYDLTDGSCTLADGTRVDGWDHFRKAHGQSAQMVNPAAAFCVDSGGAYRIVSGDDGNQTGRCTLADGTDLDAWVHFRENAPE